MTDESQTSSGPDSPPRGPDDDEAAGCSTAPDSSTVCTSYAPQPDLEDQAHDYPSQTPCASSGSHAQPSAAITSTSASHPPSTAAPPSPAQSPLSRSKPSSPSSSSPSPATTPTSSSSSLGPRRKGLTRKFRRSQRQRGRQSCTPAAREGDRRSEEERMEEDVEQEEERMEEEACGETVGHQQ
ncbi:putative protein TPRXL [Morone saxatilis]|uniref:putative protein TPRXL n=1 Tax=Morone saxatilis TaxID=34816 RepID=UPI0015E2077A|nr:putative protein TPRXL [Morone saxatilis]